MTGAARGIGRAIAFALARQGVGLFLVDIDKTGLEDTAREAETLGCKVYFKICDVSKPAEISACVAACLAVFNGLDILVNNAGVLRYGVDHELNPESWNATISVNLLAPIQFVQELLPALAAQEESHILNVCSVVGLVPVRKLASYQTSKFGLVGFSLAMRTLGVRYNIGVTSLCPGLVDTPMLDEMGPRWYRQSTRLGPFSPVISADVVARHAIASIRNNRSITVIPLGAKLLWFAYRFAPALFVQAFTRGHFRLRARKRD